MTGFQNCIPTPTVKRPSEGVSSNREIAQDALGTSRIGLSVGANTAPQERSASASGLAALRQTGSI
ncbi:hypothetical protein [Hyphomonas sp.]